MILDFNTLPRTTKVGLGTQNLPDVLKSMYKMFVNLYGIKRAIYTSRIFNTLPRTTRVGLGT